MFKGFYTVASGMIAQQRRTELLTNNISNARTPGFKEDQSTIRSFPDMLMSRINSTNIPTENGLNHMYANPTGGINAGIYMQETLANYTQGQLLETELATDVALINGQMPVNADGVEGTVMFRLQHPAGGEAYTRNGNFTVDAQGYLVSAQGLYVLNDNGQRMQVNNDDFTLNAEGMIMSGDTQVGRVGVAYAANPEVLMKQDNGLFRLDGGGNLPTAYGVQGVAFSTQQKYIESSNVDTGRAMTELMTAYRAFEANQKVLQAYDRSMEKAVNEIGKV
ncbi:Flagellar basal-body rod protein FlgG [Metalysinibacillus saudimassiliensis]|uniref:Flagellar basal-body rod protein FlgG n=1 Tax=Metalysinibacillus saudimassiliensis TaxID=1461583 RepID=A0A078MAZ5_9BACL|nr:Flagellar basal-body rod protein FlgG [Metalysinibacillus saudimassiliensis]